MLPHHIWSTCTCVKSCLTFLQYLHSPSPLSYSFDDAVSDGMLRLQKPTLACPTLREPGLNSLFRKRTALTKTEGCGIPSPPPLAARALPAGSKRVFSISQCASRSLILSGGGFSSECADASTAYLHWSHSAAISPQARKDGLCLAVYPPSPKGSRILENLAGGGIL